LARRSDHEACVAVITAAGGVEGPGEASWNIEERARPGEGQYRKSRDDNRIDEDGSEGENDENVVEENGPGREDVGASSLPRLTTPSPSQASSSLPLLTSSSSSRPHTQQNWLPEVQEKVNRQHGTAVGDALTTNRRVENRSVKTSHGDSRNQKSFSLESIEKIPDNLHVSMRAKLISYDITNPSGDLKSNTYLTSGSLPPTLVSKAKALVTPLPFSEKTSLPSKTSRTINSGRWTIDERQPEPPRKENNAHNFVRSRSRKHSKEIASGLEIV